jgi:hypothetical protein
MPQTPQPARADRAAQIRQIQKKTLVALLLGEVVEVPGRLASLLPRADNHLSGGAQKRALRSE